MRSVRLESSSRRAPRAFEREETLEEDPREILKEKRAHKGMKIEKNRYSDKIIQRKR